MMMFKKYIYIIFILFNITFTQKLLIPMDQSQNDHLKAYGIAFFALTNKINVDWLLNYRGGSFMLDNNSIIQNECIMRGVTYIDINSAEINNIYQTIEENNMDIILLEKEPKIAVYSPPDKLPTGDSALINFEVRPISLINLFASFICSFSLTKPKGYLNSFPIKMFQTIDCWGHKALS